MKRAALCAVVAIALTAVSPSARAVVEPDDLSAVTISGTVVAAETADPIAEVCVSTRPLGRNWWEQHACTDATGAYAFAVPPGTYEVQFDPTDDAYGSQWWDGADSPVHAATLVVRRGEPRAGIDAALLAGASMTGEAIDGATGERLANACIEILTAVNGPHDVVAYLHDAPKQWRLDGLPAGEFTVVVRRCDNYWRFTYAYDALTVEDATLFDLEPGENTPVGELALVAGATVKGKVTAFRSGDPLQVTVALDHYPDRSWEAPEFGTQSRRNGRYVIDDVEPGVHVPGAYEGRFPYRYAVQWAGGATSFAAATPFDMAPGETLRQSFRLKRAGVIRGTLEDAEVGAYVQAYSDTVQDFPERAGIGIAVDVDPDTDEFVIRGLPADDFYISFAPYDDDTFWYDGARDLDDAQLVHVKPHETVDLTAHYPPPGPDLGS